jgi:hypothetical protein
MIARPAALAAGFVVPTSNAWAQEGTGKAAASAAGQPYCFYQDQKFSEGATLNGRVCTRGDAAGKARQWTLGVDLGAARESRILRHAARAGAHATAGQLVQARILLAEAQADYREATVKLSGKN